MFHILILLNILLSYLEDFFSTNIINEIFSIGTQKPISYYVTLNQAMDANNMRNNKVKSEKVLTKKVSFQLKLILLPNKTQNI